MKIEKYKKIIDGMYKVTFDNGTVLDIYEDVIIKNELLFKKDIDINFLKLIENDNNYQKVYNIALKYISVRLRSVHEIEVYLKNKGFSYDVIEFTIERLKTNKLLDDEVFAKAFINDKLNFTSMGKYKLINELSKCKINNEIIDKCIYEIEDEIWIDRIGKLVNKYLKSNKKYSGNILKNKIYVYLVNLGYDKDLVINNLNKYEF